MENSSLQSSLPEYVTEQLLPCLDCTKILKDLILLGPSLAQLGLTYSLEKYLAGLQRLCLGNSWLHVKN
jgi:hypothetical protein